MMPQMHAKEQPKVAVTGAINIHIGFTCKWCSMTPITGVRYQCAVCKDYNLCGSCKDNHPGHNMVVIECSRFMASTRGTSTSRTSTSFTASTSCISTSISFYT